MKAKQTVTHTTAEYLYVDWKKLYEEEIQEILDQARKEVLEEVEEIIDEGERRYNKTGIFNYKSVRSLIDKLKENNEKD